MLIGIPKESLKGETRVAATPDTVTKLIKLGFEVAIQTNAGADASFDDASYSAAGAKVLRGRDVWQSDIIFKVNAPSDEEIKLLKEGQTLVSFIRPAQNPDLVAKLNEKKVNVLAMDMVPRISRAQAMDALSSIANISGYRAVIEAAHNFGRFFTGQVTAAGKVPPAKVLVIGAGVAGLAAIGAANSLGAIVRAFDTRLEVADQIKSMGGEFLKLNFANEDGGSSDGYAKVMSDEFIKAEMELFAAQAKEVDIIITTAAIPGKPAPRLISKEMVASMKPGSVIVDLAAGTGGNCELTVEGKVTTTENGVKIIGYSDLACRLPAQSSQLYSTNLVNLAKILCKNKDGNIDIDFEDVILRNMSVTKGGEVTFPPPKISVSAAPAAPAAEAAPPKVEQRQVSGTFKASMAALVVIAFALIGIFAPEKFLPHFTVFVLSCVVGYYVVWNVTHSLHTPLMAVTNAISGIIVVGALLQISSGSFIIGLFAFVGVLIASINIFGGFAVTRRMLSMFKKQQ
ncbi:MULTISPECIES: Re/Si-specific NAD(P)(+) transhydrogenase subunit alpha [unclassified Anaerobiospirillum]|uniref:Re/Si-specific NAD(P)(+) transhydrogenase subunit alpha n=1 Tax=unclassified Anaerobiospirillum TaxID=2647410 RepID=UPI001FF571F1|nr:MULTISPECIES: Re/Si-specific NAD(P)(+) transhydrogenase subunit alpha [unclassified Anaerobiospirillum]MCK0525723.1 Re/Si-specific NAD(P)(+) transhydrogenase subunit alpha [Anaerobiospirillum sp. NML120449]MCK0534461.1 Re/Si-specific NAD(P)(+) transhydrogenase subunit alpha [Anaerobiospirillum sp. NML120511]MCK0539741.1 Re/Si-specific NAD(P)(+) transhydrogenase subunit alpha [Anaerobiospirillum sp. NML02-A-032]